MARRDRGTVLILVLGILALLTFIAAAFAALTSVESRAGANATDGERARYTAASGLERAKFELRRAAFTPGYPLVWGMPDQYDYSTNQWVENNYFTNGYITTPPLSISLDAIETQKTPSFGMGMGVGTGNPIPGVLTDPARNLPWPSGVLGATYYTDPDNRRFKGDYYTLRVTPATAQLFLNDSNPSLAGMLDSLAGVVAGGTAPASGIGAAIVGGRPATGYARTSDIETVAALQALLTVTQIQALEPYLTCFSRVDSKVIARQKSGHPDLTLSPRAPVDINWAPFPVLVAVLSGISATNPASSVSGSIDFTTAETLARKIMQYRCLPTIPRETTDAVACMTGTTPVRRYGFSRWSEFVQFLIACPGISADQAALVMANCNPNTDLNKFFPDFSLLRAFDKSDLTAATTEFCFAPGAVFSIESLGVILGADGTIVASARARSVVRLFETYVETTQADFEADRIDPPGKELPGMRDISTLPECRNTMDFDLAAAGVTISGNNDYDTTQLGLNAATYDGQLTFNVLTKADMADSGDATYAGFIDRTVKGRRSGQALATPTLVAPLTAPPPVRTIAVSTAAGSKEGPGPLVVAMGGAAINPLTNPDFQSGTDLHPLAAMVGRGARAFAFDQDELDSPTTGVYKPSEHTFAANTVTLTDTGHVTQANGTVNPGQPEIDPTYAPSTTDPTTGVVTPGAMISPGQPYIAPFWVQAPGTSDIATIAVSLHATIDAYQYNSCDILGTEMWFKPGKTATPQMLFDWQSGGVHTLTDTTLDTVDFPSSTYPVSFSPRSRNDSASVGAQGYVQVWIDPGTSSVSDPDFSYTIKCKFHIEKPSDAAGSAFTVTGATTAGVYDQNWDYEATTSTKIYPGTWHHFAFAFKKPPQPTNPTDPVSDPVASGGHNAFFYVDGNLLRPASEPQWPTETEPSARLIDQSLTRMKAEIDDINASMLSVAAGITAGFGASVTMGTNTVNVPLLDLSNYRVPSVLQIGGADPAGTNTNVFVGCSHDGSMAGFVGLLDNVIFDSKYLIGQGNPALQSLPAGESYLPRYDCFRPSLDSEATATRSDSTTVGYTPPNSPLIFRKRTQALEWDRSIRILSYDATAWKSQPASGGTTQGEVGLGQVYLRFGWVPLGTPNSSSMLTPPADADGSSGGSGAGTNGWTASLSTAPYNSFTNGYIVPDRSSVAGTPIYTGFQTLGAKEQYNYAIAITPTHDSSSTQMGPRMAPVIDDVTITYMSSAAVNVVEEGEVVEH